MTVHSFCLNRTVLNVERLKGKIITARGYHVCNERTWPFLEKIKSIMIDPLRQNTSVLTDAIYSAEFHKKFWDIFLLLYYIKIYLKKRQNKKSGKFAQLPFALFIFTKGKTFFPQFFFEYEGKYPFWPIWDVNFILSQYPVFAWICRLFGIVIDPEGCIVLMYQSYISIKNL